MNKVRALIVFIVFIIALIPTLISLETNSQEISQNSSMLMSEELSIDVSKHSTSNDCFTIIGSNIYNITGYLALHPGGPIIVEACGKNGTELFTTKGGKGKDHSEFAKSLLNKYLVASLGEPLRNTSSSSVSGVNNTVEKNNIPLVLNNSKTENLSGITLDELSKHNKQSDCWLLINGKVYDVTAYILVHPGGVSAIRNNCGKESTIAFNTRGGSGSHSNNARNLLSSYYIGNIRESSVGNNSQNSSSGLIFTITSSGFISPLSLEINKGDTITFIYSNPGNEIILRFSPQPPNDIKLDHEYTQKTYTFNSEGTYTFRNKNGGQTATIIVD